MENVRSLADKRGILALAYTENDAPVPWQCTLTILHESNVHFTLSLAASVKIHGVVDEQHFTLRFHGDNLVPGKSLLRHNAIGFSAELFRSILQNGNPQLQTLLLTLKAPCPLWCPITLGTVASSLDTPSREFVNLAKATKIYIVFDAKRLRCENLDLLRQAVKSSKQLKGVPVNSDFNFTHRYRQIDSSVLSYVKSAESASIEDAEAGATSLVEHVVHDAKLGSYASVEDATLDALPSVEVVEDDAIRNYGAPPAYLSKRSRISKSSRQTQHRLIVDAHCPAHSPGEYPEAKRVFQDLTRPSSHGERATSGTSTAWSDATVKVDLFENTVKSAVRNVLPDVLDALLPDMLQKHLIALLASSPSPSPTPPPYHNLNTVTKHRSISSHNFTPAKHFRAVVRQATEHKLQRLMTAAEDNVEELNSQATVDVKEMLEDHTIDMRQLAEDHKALFNDECHEVLDDLKMRVEKEIEWAEEEVGERVDKVMMRARFDVEQVEGRCTCKCKCLHSREGKQPPRAMSLPLFDREAEPIADTEGTESSSQEL
jgi:hypothetical protein